MNIFEKIRVVIFQIMIHLFLKQDILQLYYKRYSISNVDAVFVANKRDADY